MNQNPTSAAQAVALPKEATGACREFLKLLDQTSKLVGLYKVHHPVPTSSLQEAYDALGRIFLNHQTPRVTAAVVDGRWVINGLVVEGADGFEGLKSVFRASEMHSLCFVQGVRLYELAAFCEMAALPPNKASEVDVAEFFGQRGVRSIIPNQARYTHAPKAHTIPPSVLPPHVMGGVMGDTTKVVSPVIPVIPAIPVPERRQEPRNAATTAQRLSGLPFGSFIKSIVDQAVQDPEERSMIYAEALRTVKEALSRRVEQATTELRAEKQAAVNEKVRTKAVLGNIADGRVTVDKDGRVLMMDPIAESIMGKKLSEIAGKPISGSSVKGEKLLSMAWETEIPGDRAVSEAMKVAADPEVISALRQSLAVVQDQEGRVVGTYGVLPHVSKFREAERVQEEFISHVTHELRAPLSAICSALEIVSEKALGKLSPEENRFLQISLKNTRNLRQMVSEILDFSKIKAGKFSVYPVPSPAGAILREAAEGLRPWALSKKIVLAWEADQAGPHLELQAMADHGRMVQVLTNLVSNAIKSTPAGGSIRLASRPGTGPHEGMVVFSVRDTGCGIAPEDQKRIFERFSQVPQNGKSREGVGLGLAIVSELVQLHGGAIWLESALGQGTTFFVSLPLAAPVATA